MNFTKHGVDLERAATVFLDPVAITIPDEEHSEAEVRWITLGKVSRPNAELRLRIYLSLDVQTYLSQRADEKASWLRISRKCRSTRGRSAVACATVKYLTSF